MDFYRPIVLTVSRFPASLQPYPCDSNYRHDADRNHADLGAATLPPDLSIPRQANAASNSGETLLTSDSIRVDGKLFAVQQGRPTLCC
jgi:hypothetical protein